MSGSVLAIRPRALGDVVLLTPALRALHCGHPGAALDVVTDARYAALVEGLPGVRTVWRLPRAAAGVLALARELRRTGYAIAVDFFGNPTSAFLAAASGARRRVGWDVRGRGAAYHVRVPRNPAVPPAVAGSRAREYSAVSQVRLALAAGGVEDGLHPAIPLPPGAREEGARLLARAGVREPARAIGLVAAGSWPTKTWPASHAGLLARDLISRGHEVVAIAGPGEERVVATLARVAPAIAVPPPCDVAAMVGMISHLRALTGLDSGPRHVAVALGVPTFAWFGPTHPDNWTPDDPRHGVWWTGLPCRGCNRTHCPHWNCMPGLDPADAAERVTRHLEAHARIAADLGSAAGA